MVETLLPLTIIVPVYNAERYLHRCIDSILSQSYSDFECILVDDGSTDGSGWICEEYARKDNRVRVFHKENRGVSSARNKGLDESKGEFIVFIDADDYIKENYLAHLMSFNADLVLTGIHKFAMREEWIIPKVFSSYELEELPNHWNTPPDMNYLYCFPIAKRFRSRIIKEKSIRFNESIFFSEDVCFNILYYSYAKSFAEFPFADYMYLMEDINRDEKFKMSADQLICHYEYIDSCFQKLYDRIEPESLSFVRDNTCLRLMRKFYFFLKQENLGAGVFVRNIKKFRKMKFSGYMLGLLQGKREKRVMNEAVYFPFLTYCFEIRMRRLISRFIH